MKEILLPFFVFIFLNLCSSNGYGQACDPNTPTYVVNLTGNPDSVWLSPSDVREGLCCTAQPPDRCVEFIITLDPGAQGIRFDIATGAVPPGALFYELNCTNPTPVGDTMCLNGTGPHRITFCKPGNNPNSYTITSISKPAVGPPIAVSDGCSGIIWATGYQLGSINWTSVPFNSVYNTYMSCSVACDTVLITAQPGYPPYIDYEVSGYPAGGCGNILERDTVRVYFISDKTATILPQNPTICFGGTNATIAAYGTGGAPPYNYLWSTGQTSQSISVAAGTYWVQISDSTNCPPVYDTVTVTANANYITAFAGSDLTTCADFPSFSLNGSVLIATGGKWTGGSGTFNPNDSTLNAVYTPAASEIATGSLTLILTTTGNGTCPLDRDTILLSITPAPTIDAGSNSTYCADISSINVNGDVTVSTGGTWTTNGTGTFNDPNSLSTTYIPSAADTGAGAVWLYLTSTGNGACMPVKDSILITLTDAPTISAGADLSVCSTNPNATLNGIVTVATGGIWSSSGTGTFSPSASTSNATYIPSNTDTAAGSVILTFTSTGNGTCNAVSDQLTLTITQDQIAVNAGPDQLACAPTFNLSGTVSVASGGVWSTSGSGTFTPSDSTLNGTYNFSNADVTAGSVYLYLTTIGNGGCLPKTDSALIQINPPVSVSITSGDTICANVGVVPVSVNVSTGQGTWSTSGSGTFQSATSTSTTYSPGATDISAGFVNLIFTSGNNGPCTAAIDTLKVTLLGAPFTNFAEADTCFNSLIQFTDLTTTGGNLVSWNWNFGDGNGSGASNPTHLYSSAGTYVVTLITTSSFGCIDTFSRPVTIAQLPTAAFSSTAQCYVDSAYFFDGSTAGTGTVNAWSWNFGDSGLSSSQNPSHAYASPGTYVVSLIATNSAGCKDTSTQTLSVQPSPKANFSNTDVCDGDANSFTDSSSISSGTIVNWQWTLGDGSTSTILSFSHLYPAVGPYSVQLVVTSSFGCKDTITKTVYVNPLPVAAFSSDGSCLGDGTNFVDMSTVPTGSVTGWKWFFGDGFNSTDQNPHHLFPTNGSYPVALIATTDKNCSDTVINVTTIYPSPKADFLPSPSVVHMFENVSFSDQSSGAVSWFYNFADSANGTATIQNPSYIYTSGGIFNVMQVVTNSDGCTDTMYREVTVTMPPVVPSGFSPNADGHNDILFVRGGPYQTLDFRVYNNWGELIFQSNMQNSGWDGSRSGVLQPMGVYVYTVHAITNDNVQYDLKGDVTLLR